MLDAAVALHEGEHLLEVLVGEELLLHHRGDQVALLVAAELQSMDERQGDLPFLEVVADALAELLLAGGVVEGVIHELEGDAEVHAVVGQRLPEFRRGAPKDGTHLAGGGEQDRRLAPHHVDVAIDGDVEVAGADELQHLAFGDDGGGVGQHLQDVEVPVGHHERE